MAMAEWHCRSYLQEHGGGGEFALTTLLGIAVDSGEERKLLSLVPSEVIVGDLKDPLCALIADESSRTRNVGGILRAPPRA